MFAYAIEESDFRRLQEINKRLYGNGSALTIDERRDLANLMQVILGRAEGIAAGEQ